MNRKSTVPIAVLSHLSAHRTELGVTNTPELTLNAPACNRATTVHKPTLLNNYGSSFVLADLTDYLENKGLDRTRGALDHP